MNMRLGLLVTVLLFSNVVIAGEKELTPEQIVQRSLDSVGPAKARQANRSRYITGTVKMHQLSAGKTELSGTAYIMSEAPDKIRLAMKFTSPDYPLEDFMFAGQKVEIAKIQPGVRSRLGDFLFQREPVLRDGLLGGPLSAASALETARNNGAKLKYDGIKTVENRRLHQVTFIPKKNSDDLTVKLFFDTETFRHVMTTYSWVRPKLGLSVNERDYHYSLDERFDEFRDFGGLVLPASYKLRFSGDSDKGPATFLYEFAWDHYNDAAIPATSSK